MSQSGIKIARVYEVQRSSSVPLDDSDDDIQESIWYNNPKIYRCEQHQRIFYASVYKLCFENVVLQCVKFRLLRSSSLTLSSVTSYV